MLNIRSLFDSICGLCAAPPVPDATHSVFAGPDLDPKDQQYGFYYYKIREPGNSGAVWSWAAASDSRVIAKLEILKHGQIIRLHEDLSSALQAQIRDIDIISNEPLYRIPKDLPPFLNLDKAYINPIKFRMP